jgi:hypothetical protein
MGMGSQTKNSIQQRWQFFLNLSTGLMKLLLKKKNLARNCIDISVHRIEFILKFTWKGTGPR